MDSVVPKKVLEVYFPIVRQVLNTEWDPIGVPPTLEDEYDRYARKVVSLLFQRRDEFQISKYLFDIEKDWSGDEYLDERKKVCDHVAIKLLLVTHDLHGS